MSVTARGGYIVVRSPRDAQIVSPSEHRLQLDRITDTVFRINHCNIVIPMYLTRIGQSRYEVIALVWLLFGYFGLFDLGLSQATANHLARSENQSPSRQWEIFWTASVINTLLGIAAGMLFLLIGDFIVTSFVSIPVGLKAELRAATLWVACLLPLSTTSAVFVGTLEAHERFLELNVIQVIGASLGQLAPLAAVVLFGPQIEIAVAATVMARLVTAIPIFILAMRQCACPSLPTIRRKTVQSLFRYGGWITVTNIVGPILISVDQFMIAAIAGVASVPRYAIPFNFATRILLVPAAMTRALFPQLARVDLEAARQRAESVTITVSLSLVILCAPLIIVISHVLTIWLGSDFSSKASTLSRIILLGVWINGVAYVPFTMLQSQGRPSATAKLHVLELLAFLAILWLGLHFLGLIGAALAWSLRVLVDAIFLFRSANFSKNILRNLAPSVLFLIAAFGISIFTDASAIGSMFSACVMLIVAMTYAYAFDAAFANIYSKLSFLKMS
jgi:O-antigen/teichoic acid export membrane protein